MHIDINLMCVLNCLGIGTSVTLTVVNMLLYFSQISHAECNRTCVINAHLNAIVLYQRLIVPLHLMFVYLYLYNTS